MLTSGVTSARSVVLASSDAGLRTRLRTSLSAMRWTVHEASGGAEAMAQMEEQRPEALLVDSWLPDLEAGAFAGHVALLYPGVDLLRLDGDPLEGGMRSPRRHELLHAMREAQETQPGDTVAWAAAPVEVPPAGKSRWVAPVADRGPGLPEVGRVEVSRKLEAVGVPAASSLLPEMIGESQVMRELARLIRLVAPRSATVLIEGETGTGKEVVAKALHRLSARAHKPFAVLNCAAIPEALLEAELFGHTRGAFTGAVQSRVGRIEAANGGTLFLDEIGEMPLALQAKMLRFLECGELQKVGENETMRVDVRVIAATHQLLEQRAEEGKFRLDLYHRLAVFPLEVPPLRERLEDVPLLANHFLAEMGKEAPRKRLLAGGLALLAARRWPGNVRELAHALERASILAGDSPEIGAEHLQVRRSRGVRD